MESLIPFLTGTIGELHAANNALANALEAELAERELRPLTAVEALGDHPGVMRIIHQARLETMLTGVVVTAPGRAEVLKLGSPEGINATTLDGLVSKGAITPAEAGDIAKAAELYAVSGDEPVLYKHLRAVGGAASTQVLATWSEQQWGAVLGEAVIPAGSTVADTARVLSRRLAAMRPAAALKARLPSSSASSIESSLIAIAVLADRNPQRFAMSFDQLDLRDVRAEELADVEAAWAKLNALVQAYPGQGLAAIFDGPGTEKARASDAEEQVEHVRAAIDAGGGAGGVLDVLRLDLSKHGFDPATLGLESAGGAVQDAVRATLRTYQRIRNVAADVGDAAALVARGYGSAHAIAARPRKEFAGESGLPADRAEAVWHNARALALDAALVVGGLVDRMSDANDVPAATAPPPSATTTFADLDGYDRLFGSLSYCDCEQCASLLGPAAYFVDLMGFVDQHVRPQLPTNPPHQLDLKTRRPDLWTLPLTCANSDDRVSTLGLVLEIMENDIGRRNGLTDFSNRAGVENDVYGALRVASGSLRLPYLDGLSRVGTLLAAHGTSRVALLTALGASEAGRLHGYLEQPASPPADVVFSQSLATMEARFGMAFTGDPVIAPIDVAALQTATGLDRDALGTVIASWFVHDGAPAARIVADKRDADSVQNDVEWVRDLTVEGLNRVERLVWFARVLGWKIEQLDEVLEAAGQRELGPDLLLLMGRAAAATARFGAALGAGDLALLAGRMTAARRDRMFNPAWQRGTAPWPQPTQHFIHPAFLAAPTTPDPAVFRLTSGLGISLDELELLVRALAPMLVQESAPGFSPEAALEADRYFVLSIENLSLLARHALLARLFGLSVGELVLLMRVAEVGPIDGLDAVLAFVEYHDGWRAGGRSLRELLVATGLAIGGLDAVALAAAARIAAVELLVIHDAVFATTLGMSEGASRAVIAANPGWFEQGPAGQRWLAADADLASAPIAVPPDALVPDRATRRLVTVAELRTVLAGHGARAVLVRTLAQASGRTEGQVGELLALAGRPIGAAEVRAVRGDDDPAAAIAVILGFAAVEIATRGLDADALALLRIAPARFGAGAWPATEADTRHDAWPWFSLAQLATLSTYARLAAGSAERAADVHTAIAGFDPVTATFATTADVDEALARLLAIEPGRLPALRAAVTLPASGPRALAQLAGAAALAVQLRVEGHTLTAAVSDDELVRRAAADTLAQSLDARAADDPALAPRATDALATVRELRRAGLIEYLRRGLLGRPFDSTAALSGYFLVDVEAGSCSTTSRVIAATNSVQQYVQRISLGVEVDHVTPSHLALHLSEEATAEWEWRRTYRVWEANRKVFLWPENYLEPSVRDDATPLFRQLEDDLQQGELDPTSIVTAYATYLRGLETLSTLQLAGAYHDKADARDVLHLVGVTKEDPPTFYYRSCEDLLASERDPSRAPRWSPWQVLDVAIPVREVAPVVFRGRLHVLWAEIKTRPRQGFIDGNSNFLGYRHQFSMSFTSLMPDGKWTAPQELTLPDALPWRGFEGAPGVVNDSRRSDHTIPHDDLVNRHHDEALEGYTLGGRHWRGVWPHVGLDSLTVGFRHFRAWGTADLYARQISNEDDARATLAPSVPVLGRLGNLLRTGRTLGWRGSPANTANIVLDPRRVTRMLADLPADEADGLQHITSPVLVGTDVASVPPAADGYAIPGSAQDVIFAIAGDLIALQGSVTPDDRYVARRLGSSIVAGLSRDLYERGLDGLLATARQLDLAEAPLPITPSAGMVIDHSGAGTVDFGGPFGTYFRELWFHIPVLIATALQARGRHGEARAWFHRVFDPTSNEVIPTAGVPSEDVERVQLDRVWRYRELRGLGAERLRASLLDGGALDAYRRDPFNPHAIARRRPTAYQKFVFRRYVENLLDWADLLFTQFTMETVDEARMLYQLVGELLGPRPARIGDCGGAPITPRDYATIAPLLDAGSELLIELESEIAARRFRIVHRAPPVAATMLDEGRLTFAQAIGTWTPPAVPARPASFAAGWIKSRTESWTPAKGAAISDGTIGPLGMGGRTQVPAAPTVTAGDGFPESLWRELGPVFCVPVNKTLLGLWDRVDDRLWKIRHCMDVDGNRRELALLAPEIDPATRVAAAALGLPLEELVADAAREVPPYRFSYLIDRAKGYASTLSAFGGALLGALDRRDNAALTKIRSEQALSLARLTTSQRELDVDVAEEGLAAVEQQQRAATYRLEYYQALVAEDRNGYEVAEQNARRAGILMRVVGTSLEAAGGAAHLTPQAGSPFAMTYGGVQVGSSLDSWAAKASSTATMLEQIAAAAATEGSYVRRRREWMHQVELARFELDGLVRQQRAAQLRLQIARRALVAHEASVTQLEDVQAFERDRFTNLGLHTKLATLLQRMYRSAYGQALALARLAERAFRFERGDEVAGLGGSYWDAGIGGLLAGERLLSDLQILERRFLESNHRELELDQPFALSQIDPAALVRLRETGECELSIPEIAFEVAYPGHWRRRLRSVRLTIPCVTGPYVNIGATLTLLESKVRATATPNGALAVVPPAHGVTIATSTAQNDGGVFELSFRDERYLPFEGLGAVSRWKLTLPKVVRPFDYASMTDVIVSLAYSARGDDALRALAEGTAATTGSILHHHTAVSTTRIFSLRQDAAAAFTRLVRSPASTAIGFEISDRQLPPVFRGRALTVMSAALVLRVGPGVTVGAPTFSLDGAAVGGFTPDAALGGLLRAAIGGSFLSALRGPHTLSVAAAGGLAPASPSPGDVAAIEPDSLLDVMLALELRLAT